MKIESMDAHMLARKLRVRLNEIGQPVSLDAAHALMVSHPEADVKTQYGALVYTAKVANSKRDDGTENDAHSALKYLISFTGTHRYDEKKRQSRKNVRVNYRGLKPAASVE